MQLAFALAVALSAAALPPEGGGTPVLYLVGEPTVVRSAPSSKARAVSKLETLDIVSGTEAARGWLQIEGSSADSASSGWVPFAPDNVVRGPLDALRARVFRVREARWPMRVKIDVLRGRVRPGFTGEQVKLALGDPLKKDLRRIGQDVREEWVYADQRILFSHTGVRVVETLGK